MLNLAKLKELKNQRSKWQVDMTQKVIFIQSMI